jgi:hypothetical protein
MENRGTSPAYSVDWAMEDVTVHDNTVCVTGGSPEGAIVVYGFTDDTFFTSRGNSFTDNTYKGAGSGNFNYFYGTRTFTDWKGTWGQDTTSSRTVSATCP